jgi:hypothetical protein
MLSRIIRRACEPSIPNNREESWVAQTSLPRCVGNRREAAGHLSPPRLRGSKMLALAYEHIVRRGGGSARKSINFRSISTRNGEVTRAVLAEPQAERAGESASCVIRRVGVTFFLSSQKPSPEILRNSRTPVDQKSRRPNTLPSPARGTKGGVSGYAFTLDATNCRRLPSSTSGALAARPWAITRRGRDSAPRIA